jgi:biotin carboxyl carrier protein
MTKKRHNLPDLTDLKEIIIDDVAYKSKTNKMYDNRQSYKPHNPLQLKAFMPGNIQEVFVQEGQEVKNGEQLLILEAMKMKNMIVAPFDGKVKILFVKQGDIVAKNFVLIELE